MSRNLLALKLVPKPILVLRLVPKLTLKFILRVALGLLVIVASKFAFTLVLKLARNLSMDFL